MPRLSSILADLADVKIFLGVIATLAGSAVAFANLFGNAELSAIVGYVIAGAAFAYTVVSAYLIAFSTGQVSQRRG